MYLNIINHKAYTKLCDELDAKLGPIPRTKAIIVGDDFGSPPQICVDFQSHFTGKPIEFIANLSISYIEELIHSSDPTKTETQIHEDVYSAIEGFLEIKLPESVKLAKLEYAKQCDALQAKYKKQNLKT